MLEINGRKKPVSAKVITCMLYFRTFMTHAIMRGHYHSRHTIGFGMYQGNTIQANTLFGERDLFIILYTMPKNFKNFKNWALRLKMQQQKIKTGTERV